MKAEKKNGHFRILLGDDHSEHARAAVALLEDGKRLAQTDALFGMPGADGQEPAARVNALAAGTEAQEYSYS